MGMISIREVELNGIHEIGGEDFDIISGISSYCDMIFLHFLPVS
jgi:hypothetical protein